MPPKEHSNKYLCSICNIWIADNRAQREQHESGQKHKTAKVRLLKEIAKKNASHRSERPEAVARAAAQQLLEHVAKSVDDSVRKRIEATEENERDVKNRDVRGVSEVIGADQAVDQHGYPVPAQEMYGWRQDDNSDERGWKKNDYIRTEALGEFAPDEPESVSYDNGKGGDGQNGYSLGNADESLDNVREEQDPEERKLLQNSFKKRSAPKSRRKRRAR